MKTRISKKFLRSKPGFTQEGLVRARVLARGDQTTLVNNRKMFGWYSSFGDYTVVIFKGISMRSIMMKAKASGLQNIFDMYKVRFN